MITLDILEKEQILIEQASQLAGMSIEQFVRVSVLEKAKAYTEADAFESDAWKAGQGLFGCYEGDPDLSENAKAINAKAITEQHIKEKYVPHSS